MLLRRCLSYSRTAELVEFEMSPGWEPFSMTVVLSQPIIRDKWLTCAQLLCTLRWSASCENRPVGDPVIASCCGAIWDDFADFLGSEECLLLAQFAG